MATDLPLVAVLAAGRARRFGGGKLDAPCAGKPLGQWALDAVSEAGLEPGMIVVGPQVPRFALEARGWHLLHNPDPAAGQGGSVALAARHAAMQGRALLVLLADMPMVDPAHLRRLAGCAVNAATRYPDGRAGVPVCLRGAALGKLEALSGERGAGAILSGLAGLEVLEAEADSLIDVDSPEDLERARRMLAGC
ncbi:MAG: nucleotidyltransferase family protein [Erythrobacter sp.]|nr:nucleotidyltransferase family protein [Erythrobacter sp.]